MRRVGKSTVLYQIMDLLEAEGIENKAMLHINFEEPALAPHLTLSFLDTLYDTYRSEIYPTGKAYLFLDEIQNILEWERWVRGRNETENIKIFITGSSSKLMSSELATLLTGRHVNFNVYPLDLKELLEFFSIEIPSKPWPFSAPPAIAHTLHFYLKWGSLPKIVLAKEEARRSRLLIQYFDDILLKDIVMRHRVRDVHTLRAMAVHLLTQTGSLASFSRLGKIFESSTFLAGDYCNYLQEAFLLELMPFFSLKAAERQRNPKKIYVTDLGLRNQVSLSLSPDRGKSIESLIFNVLKQRATGNIFYWKNQGEIDFVINRGASITTLIQVLADHLDNPAVFNREVNALREGMKAFPKAKPLIIIGQQSFPESAYQVGDSIQIAPLWQFLLEPETFL